MVDCEQLAAIHFVSAWPEIVHPASLRHASFVRFDPLDFVKFCKRHPNLTRLTLTTDSSLFNFCSDLVSSSWNQYDVFRAIRHKESGLIDEDELRCLERLELDLDVYLSYPLDALRDLVRGLRRGLWSLRRGGGKKVYKRLSLYFGSLNVFTDENYFKLFDSIQNQFESNFYKPKNSCNSATYKRLNLYLLTYSDLVKHQVAMSGLIPDLRHLMVDEPVDLSREQPIYKLANLRFLKVHGNVLDRSERNHPTTPVPDDSGVGRV